MPFEEDLEVFVIFVAPWFLRVIYGSWMGNQYDASLFLSSILCAQEFFLPRRFQQIFFDGKRTTVSLSFFALAVSIIVSLYILRLIPSRRTTAFLDGELDGQIDRSAMRPRKDGNLKPLIFPCRTNHTRFFPKRHSFSYSYLFVGIPVDWCGSIGSLLSADVRATKDNVKVPKSAWFSVDSADYLARGESRSGLRGKLDTYLQSQVSEDQLEDLEF